MHERLSIHQMCFADMPVGDYIRHCHELGAQRIGFISPALQVADNVTTAVEVIADTGLAVQSIAHVFHSGHLTPDKRTWQQDRDRLFQLIDIAAELRADSIYMLTGGHGDLDWSIAADCFSRAIAPCAERAKSCGIKLGIENASSLYADLHIAHSLADTVTLAEMANIGVCVELFFCWAEANLPVLLRRAMPRCQLVQLSDYCYGDRSLPARAVPGDGVIPIKTLIGEILKAGYSGGFDIELLGPRIIDEGASQAVARSAKHLTGLLNDLLIQ